MSSSLLRSVFFSLALYFVFFSFLICFRFEKRITEIGLQESFRMARKSNETFSFLSGCTTWSLFSHVLTEFTELLHRKPGVETQRWFIYLFFLSICLCVCVSMYVCMYVCMYGCVCVCICVCGSV